MEFELQPATADNDEPGDTDLAEGSTFRISSRPVITRSGSEEESIPDSSDLPRSYGTETLCLMARDPGTVFAYWDIDWPGAFREQPPMHRKVHLRLLTPDGAEITSVEVEPMAGNCYVTVPDADSAYRGEIGYFSPPTVWNRLASSEVVTTPADTLAETEEVDFATVPFHLSFQHMIDRLRISKQENTSLTSMLVDLRERAASPEKKDDLTVAERELARAMEEGASNAPAQSSVRGASDFWTQQRIERIFGVGGTSPSSGFGGSSHAI